VGYLETKGNVYFFAINRDEKNDAGLRERRINLTKQILTDLGHIKPRLGRDFKH
jgi:beta-lactamase class D